MPHDLLMDDAVRVLETVKVGRAPVGEAMTAFGGMYMDHHSARAIAADNELSERLCAQWAAEDAAKEAA